MTEEQRFFGIGDKKSSKASFFYRSGRQVLVNTLYICKFLWFLFFFNLLRESAMRRAARQFFFSVRKASACQYFVYLLVRIFLLLFIGPEFYHWLCLSLTHWLTNSLRDVLIDVTLACEDANSKLVKVVTVADVNAEDHVGNSLLHIWELTFGPKANFVQTLSIRLVKILKLKFRQDYEAGVCSAFCRWWFVEVMKLNLGRDSEARFGQDFEF